MAETTTCPFIDGEILEGVVFVEWIAQHMFLVHLSQDDPTQSLQIALPSVELPRKASSQLEYVIQATLDRLNQHSDIVLRMDFLSRLPLEGYADILFRKDDTDAYESLERCLLAAGVARVCRPGLHCNAALLQDEEAGSTWTVAHHNDNHRNGVFEDSMSGAVAKDETTNMEWNQTLSGTVVDAVRGDYLRVRVNLKQDVPNALFREAIYETVVREAQHYELPRKLSVMEDLGSEVSHIVVLLISVAGIRCENPSTEIGFQAMRFAQTFLYHQRVEITCHHMAPRDKDIANTTQEERLHQLAHLRGTVRLLQQAEGGGYLRPCRWSEPSFTSAESEERDLSPPSPSLCGAVEKMFADCNGDLSRTLVRFALAKIRQQMDFLDPRPSSYRQLLRDLDTLSSSSSSCTTLLQLWQQYLCEGDVLATSPLTLHSWVPLKFLVSLPELSESSSELSNNYIHNVSVLFSNLDAPSMRTETPTQTFPVLCVSVMMSLPNEWVEASIQRRKKMHLGAIRIEPTETEWSSSSDLYLDAPGLTIQDYEHQGEKRNNHHHDVHQASEEDEDAISPLVTPDQSYGPFIRVEYTYDGEGSEILTFRKSIRTYDRNLFHMRTHQAKWVSLNPSGNDSFTLELPQGVHEKVFVVDIHLTLASGANLKKTAVYVLHREGKRNALLVGDGADAMESIAVTDQSEPTSSSSEAIVATSATNSPASANKGFTHSLVDYYLPLTQASGTHDSSLWDFLDHCRDLIMFQSCEWKSAPVVVLDGRAGFLLTSNVLHRQEQTELPATKEGAIPNTVWDRVAASMDKFGLQCRDVPSLSSDTRCVILGSTPLVDSAETAPCTALLPHQLGPNGISLLSFAVTPRQLFVCNPDHHHAIIAKSEREQMPTYAHIDSAFIRLSLSRLPNLLLGNVEWMPMGLRDVQRNLRITLDQHATKGERGREVFSVSKTASASTTAGPPSAGETACMTASVELSLHQPTECIAFERSMASLMALLMMAAPRCAEPHMKDLLSTMPYFRVHDDALPRTSGLLYTVRTDEGAASTCHHSSNSVLVIGTATSRDRNALSDVFEPILHHRVSTHTLVSMISSLGLNSLRNPMTPCSDVRGLDADDGADRPMGRAGFGPRHAVHDDPNWLYRPLNDGFVVVGDPLAETSEPDVHDALNPSPSNNPKQAHIALQYIPFRLAGRKNNPLKNLYRMQPYGQLGRGMVFEHRMSQTQRGKDLMDYFSLLLRRTKRFGFPDGLMKVIGNAHEPLYVMYLARRTLRFGLSLNWNLMQLAPPDNNATNPTPVQEDMKRVDEEEHDFFKTFITIVKETMTTAMAKLRERGLLGSATSAERSVVYRAEVYPSDFFAEISFFPMEETTTSHGEEVENSEPRVAADIPGPATAARNVQYQGTVFGRLAALRCQLRWVGQPRYFETKFEDPHHFNKN